MAGDLKIFTLNEFGRLVPGIPTPPQEVTGIDKLVQIVALTLLNNGGRSIASPGRAGGLRQLIGLNYDPDDPSELFADIRLIVNRAEQIIKEDQAKTKRTAAERLLQLQLVDVVSNESELSADVVVAVINEEQDTSKAVVNVI